MPTPTQDVFLSHAGADKRRYIEPLAAALRDRGITFWLDSHEISWGDDIVSKMNQGLRGSRFAIVCLSKNFIDRPWPTNELSSVLALQNDQGIKRVLPLILDSKDEVFQTYPLLAGFAYKEFSEGPVAIAEDLARLLQKEPPKSKVLHVAVESRHTGVLSNMEVSPLSSVRWLIDKASSSLKVTNQADTGAYVPFRIRWVLVDARADQAWYDLPRSAKRKLYAMVHTASGVNVSTNELDRIASLGVDDNTTFHLYAIEDENFDVAAAAAE